MEERAGAEQEQGKNVSQIWAEEFPRDPMEDILADAEMCLDALGGCFSFQIHEIPLERARQDAIELVAAIERLMDARGIGYV